MAVHGHRARSARRPIRGGGRLDSRKPDRHRLASPTQPARLPPVESVSYDAARSDGVFASASSDYLESHHRSERHLDDAALQPLSSWFETVAVGYDSGFVIASNADLDLAASQAPFRLRIVLPGRGLLSIVVGIVLLNFPGKFRLERWLVSRRPVRDRCTQTSLRCAQRCSRMFTTAVGNRKLLPCGGEIAR